MKRQPTPLSLSVLQVVRNGLTGVTFLWALIALVLWKFCSWLGISSGTIEDP